VWGGLCWDPTHERKFRRAQHNLPMSFHVYNMRPGTLSLL